MALDIGTALAFLREYGYAPQRDANGNYLVQGHALPECEVIDYAGAAMLRTIGDRPYRPGERSHVGRELPPSPRGATDSRSPYGPKPRPRDE